MKLGWMLSALVGLTTGQAFAAAKHKDLSLEQQRAIHSRHQTLNRSFQPKAAAEVPARPVSEVEEAGYFFMSSGTDFDSAEAKKIMVKNLPSTVTAVIFAETGSNLERIRKTYKDLIPADRLKIVELENATSGFWARDGLPIAVYPTADTSKIAMVDAQYYYDFEPDKEIAGWFNAPVIKHKYNYEGGNFMVNDLGDCLTVDNDLSSEIPLSIFKEDYGCKNVIRLPFVKGIGHADESVRFMKSKTVVTDTPEYVDTLKAQGFEVVMLPRPSNTYETYVNALLVNDTIFVPIFSEDTDKPALAIYSSFGLKVVPIETSSLSNDGEGSLHCITMTYPKVPFQSLMKQLGGRVL